MCIAICQAVIYFNSYKIIKQIYSNEWFKINLTVQQALYVLYNVWNEDFLIVKGLDLQLEFKNKTSTGNSKRNLFSTKMNMKN